MKILFLLVLLNTLFTHHTWASAPIHVERIRKTSSIISIMDCKDRIIFSAFSSKDSRLIIIDEGDNAARYGELKAALKATQCHIGVNGGFFADNRQQSPLGLLIEDSTCISPIASRGFTSAGVLYDTGKEIRLERRQQLSHSIGSMKAAIQSGPFLVDKGKCVSGLNNKNKDKRTFIATDGKGNWLLGISSALTLRELATWLAESPAPFPFKIQRALNLDGGSSTAFYEATTDTYRPSVKRIRNYVGIKKR